MTELGPATAATGAAKQADDGNAGRLDRRSWRLPGESLCPASRQASVNTRPLASKALTGWPCRGKLLWLRVGVTKIGPDGTICRRALATWCLADADRWGHVIGQVLTMPPAYQAMPGRPVYIICTSGRAVLIGEQDLTGPLRDLVTAILATGDPA